MKAVRPRLTYADLARMPADGRRYELYDGELFVVPTPLPRHQVTNLLIYEMLRHRVRKHGGFVVTSPIDIVFSDFDVVQPDLVYFTPARAHLVNLDRVIHDAPDLCVEVMSPSTAASDRGRTLQTFARYGVPEYWIADPAARTLEVFELRVDSYTRRVEASEDDVVRSVILNGHVFAVRGLFPDQ